MRKSHRSLPGSAIPGLRGSLQNLTFGQLLARIITPSNRSWREVAGYPSTLSDIESGVEPQPCSYVAARATGPYFMAPQNSGMGEDGAEITTNSKPVLLSTISDLVGDMERGLDRNEFFFMFQPRMKVLGARVCGFEALMRWHHPVSGLLMPSSFISVVKDSELASRFTDLLLSSAIDLLKTWKARGHCALTLSINISASELTKVDLPGKLRALTESRDVPANLLQLELIDVLEPARLDFLSGAITAVRATGVSVALDDFGGGLAPLTLLHQLPVDTLKIDRSLVRSVPGNAESRFMLETLIRLGQRLGKQIVLEGIETEAQLAWAQTVPEIECQGYYISEPVVEAGMEILIAQSDSS